MSVRRKSAGEIEAGDESKLAELGYAQELKRDWSVLHNFGVSFSIISVITGITTLFRYAPSMHPGVTKSTTTFHRILKNSAAQYLQTPQGQ
jgi:lipoprotein signal peptidase